MTSYYDPALTGLVSKDQCQCAPNWEGDNCEESKCADLLDPVSLGLLLIEAGYPEELRPGDQGITAVVAVRIQVEAILRTADTDGNDHLSVAEGVAAAQLLDMDLNPSDFTTNVWSQPRSPEVEPQLTFPFDDTPSTFLECRDACHDLSKGMLCPNDNVADLAYTRIAVASGMSIDTGIWTGLLKSIPPVVVRGWESFGDPCFPLDDYEQDGRAGQLVLATGEVDFASNSDQPTCACVPIGATSLSALQRHQSPTTMNRTIFLKNSTDLVFFLTLLLPSRVGSPGRTRSTGRNTKRPTTTPYHR